jgi:hypothetical protein
MRAAPPGLVRVGRSAARQCRSAGRMHWHPASHGSIRVLSPAVGLCQPDVGCPQPGRRPSSVPVRAASFRRPPWRAAVVHRRGSGHRNSLSRDARAAHAAGTACPCRARSVAPTGPAGPARAARCGGSPLPRRSRDAGAHLLPGRGPARRGRGAAAAAAQVARGAAFCRWRARGDPWSAARRCRVSVWRRVGRYKGQTRTGRPSHRQRNRWCGQCSV